MTYPELIDKHIGLVYILAIASGIIVIFILLYALLFSRRIRFLFMLYDEAKKENEPATFSKSFMKKLRKKPPVFASSTKDNTKGYKQVKESFVGETDFVTVELDCKDFDALFGTPSVLVYEVHDTEFSVSDPESNRKKCPVQNPLYLRIAKYCVEREIPCILACKPGKIIDIPETDPSFNSLYITTVQYYSKLRETLYILTRSIL